MTLIEKNKTVNIPFDLFYEDVLVAKLNLRYIPYSPRISIISVFRNDLIPYEVRENKLSMISWFILRCFQNNNHRNILLTQYITQTLAREKHTPFFLSLFSNSVNLADKYWINVDSVTRFNYDQVKIQIIPNKWQSLNPFENKIISSKINKHIFNDCYFYEPEENMDLASLNWATNGDAVKRWLLINNIYVLEKKLSEKQYKKEIETLEFFKKNNIKIPQYTIDHVLVEEDYNKYDIDTIKNGYYSLKKECLTNTNTHLISVIEYVDNDITIENPIRRMCSFHNVSENEIEHFLNTIHSYKEQFGIESDGLLDTRNFGLLVDRNGNAEPVVWSGLQLDPCPFNNFKNK